MLIQGVLSSSVLIILSILFLIFESGTEAALTYDCPEPMDIYPCYCEDDDDDPWVFCNHLHTPEQIYQGVKGLSGFRIYKMSFFMNWILEPVKPDAFSGLAVERLLFENSTINLQAPQFKGMENHLNSIHFRSIYNKTNPLVNLELDHLTKLREIVFEKNRIVELPNEWLKSVPESLRSVSVEDNTIVSIGDEAFAKVKRLTFMVLDGNRIVIIKRSMFPQPANELRSLSLNSNRIRYLASDIFSDMPSLRSLEITNNRITTLDENTWSSIIAQLTKLDISSNPLECDGQMKWLYSGHKKPILLYGRCQAPERLKDRTLSELTLAELN